MNKKKNQTSIDLDAIMTEVLNLFNTRRTTRSDRYIKQ